MYLIGTLLTATLATCVSAGAPVAREVDTLAALVTLYQHVKYGGLHYDVSTASRCVPLPPVKQTLTLLGTSYHQASSIKFRVAVTCDLFYDRNAKTSSTEAWRKMSPISTHSVLTTKWER
ncbi:Uncharacterized protein TPAR_02993 [Tolypocladium paradoxum]|uniref:Uncharacterized protein n=1 Tax=Tolypocladium paradoxum TaxID=94208 RepID=A0A2S4L303_9HYPO|nr:Uncharacterized protein TPAR_02993 [Tolypocladium paradoxum]